MAAAPKPAAARVYQIPKVEPTPEVRSKSSKQHKAMAPTEPGTLGHAIRTARLAKGWTQAHLGDLVDVHQAQISAFERGDVRSPDPEVLARLDAALGFEHGYLFELAGWRHSRHIADLVPVPGAIVIEDPAPVTEHIIDIVGKLTEAEAQRLAELAESVYRARGGSPKNDATDNEAGAG